MSILVIFHAIISIGVFLGCVAPFSARARRLSRSARILVILVALLGLGWLTADVQVHWHLVSMHAPWEAVLATAKSIVAGAIAGILLAMFILRSFEERPAQDDKTRVTINEPCGNQNH